MPVESRFLERIASASSILNRSSSFSVAQTILKRSLGLDFKFLECILIMNTHGRGLGLSFGRGDVFSRSVVEGTHSRSNVALPTKFTRDFVDHMGPHAIGVFDSAGF